MTTENTTTPAPVATLAEFIDTPVAEGALSSFDCCLEWADDIRGNLAGWIGSRVKENADSADPEGGALDDLRDVIDNLQGAVSDARLFVARYFEQSGLIAKVREAIIEFDNLPTDENRLKLAEVSQPLRWHFIEMDAPTKAVIRKYAEDRVWRANIHYGAVHALALDHYKRDKIVKAALAG